MADDDPDLEHVRRALREHDRDAARERPGQKERGRGDDAEPEPSSDQIRESLREHDRERDADEPGGAEDGT